MILIWMYNSFNHVLSDKPLQESEQTRLINLRQWIHPETEPQRDNSSVELYIDIRRLFVILLFQGQTHKTMLPEMNS